MLTRTRLAVGLLMALLMAAGAFGLSQATLAGAQAGGQMPLSCTVAWHQVPSASAAGTNYLLDVKGVAANDLWAVGYSGGLGAYRTLALHWDGNTWTVVPTPNAGPGHDNLAAVAAISANDVWAAGHVDPPNGGLTQTILLHWNGQQWTLDPQVVPGTLLGITAVSSNDVWTVGYVGNYGSYHTLIRHWDGSNWTTVSSPDGVGSNYLTAVASHGANDVWAVGRTEVQAGSGAQTLTLHWNGTAWSLSPNPVAGQLDDVSIRDGSDVWAVGQVGPHGSTATLARHWNGSAWTTVASPVPGPGNSYFISVVALSANEVWAVGANDPPNGGLTRVITAHWDGTAWTLDPGPVPGTLMGITASSDGELWAVGYVGNYEAYSTLVERAGRVCAPPTPQPTAPPSPLPTRTPAPDLCKFAIGWISGCITSEGCATYKITLQNLSDSPITLDGMVHLQGQGVIDIGHAVIPPTTLAPHSTAYVDGNICGVTPGSQGSYRLLVRVQDVGRACPPQVKQQRIYRCNADDGSDSLDLGDVSSANQ